MALVLWSGGCDSTLVLWRLLQEQKPSDPPTRTLAINHPQFGGNMNQKEPRKRILANLKEKGFRIAHQEINIESPSRPRLMIGGSQGCLQPLIWLPLGILALETGEDLHMGYIRGDDIWHYRNRLFETFDQLANIAYRTGKLCIPLEWVGKHKVLAELKPTGLLRYAWWCEQSRLKRQGCPCGRCPSCITHKLAI